jgi:NAD(P)-dependent dehydrogenase (short-subunit alcohol dehydrogenase family)
MNTMEGSAAELLGMAGKKIIVIGAGQGIGESASVVAARAGADVAVVDVDIARATLVADKVRTLGRLSLALSADATDDRSLRDAIASVDNQWSGFDGLVLVVGAASWTPLLEMDPEEWDADHRRNLRYVFVSTQEAARRLIARGRAGSFVTITSVDGIRSGAYHASYAAAKAGLVNYVKSATAEWLPHRIRINAVAPGTIATPRIPMSEEEEREHARMLPAGRRGQVDDIGRAVLFFLSDLSAPYVSGQTLAVDGGLTAVGPLDYATLGLRAGSGGTLGVTTAQD